MMAQSAERTRDAERTREAILVAAEDHFARFGFEATSLHQIAEAAGVARSTPAYFFGSKDALYDAVLARAIARGRDAMASAYGSSDSDRSPEDAVESFVAALVEFLGHDQNFLWLMQREALGGGSRVAEFYGRAVEDARIALGPAAENAGIAPERLLLDLVALCWYPFAHEHTLLPALGMKARDSGFLEEQKRHLVDLVRGMSHQRPRRQRS